MIDRRGFLRVGSIAGLSLAQALRLQAAQPGESRRRDVNCIFIFTLGGMSHHDLWDFKPDAPAEIRGDFHAINTNVPGIRLTDLLPHTARVTNKLAIVRSMTHPDSDHGRGYHIMMTGLVQPLTDGQKFPLTLTFDKAGAREVTVTVQKVGSMGPGTAMPGMDMPMHH